MLQHIKITITETAFIESTNVVKTKQKSIKTTLKLRKNILFLIYLQKENRKVDKNKSI